MTIAAPSVTPVRYTVRFDRPQTHYAEVEATLPATGPALEVFLPVWTPGSYLVREYAKNIESFAAEDPAARPLAWQKISKNRWRIDTSGATHVRLRYRVYCREMSVRTNWVDQNFALLNGAATFIAPVGQLDLPYQVKVDLPASWSKALSGMKHGADDPTLFDAPNYDTLVDSPIVAGNPAVYEFTEGGKPHYLVNVGETGDWDGPRAVADMKKIVAQNVKMWGSLPYDQYLFFNILTNAGGGLEHKNSTVLMISPYAMRSKASYLGTFTGERPRGGWLDLVSHEYFHLWNVKRLRPIALGPFRYEEENYTPDLWISEGITDYYASLNLVRAGLLDEKQYLSALTRQVEALEKIPGRKVQPVAIASFDAWIKFYRPDENTDNTAVSYYTKGAVLGFVLDAAIRQSTAGAKSLDDVMRLSFERFSGERGFTSAEWRAIASQVAGKDLSEWFAKYVDGTAELDYQPASQWFGIRLAPAKPPAPEGDVPGYLGATTQLSDGRLLVTQVPRDTPAYLAGIDAGDELVAINGRRLRGNLVDVLRDYPPSTTIEFLVSRQDRIQRVSVTLGNEPKRLAWEIDPNASEDRKLNRNAWLQR